MSELRRLRRVSFESCSAEMKPHRSTGRGCCVRFSTRIHARPVPQVRVHPRRWPWLPIRSVPRTLVGLRLQPRVRLRLCFVLVRPCVAAATHRFPPASCQRDQLLLAPRPPTTRHPLPRLLVVVGSLRSILFRVEGKSPSANDAADRPVRTPEFGTDGLAPLDF